jgi:signal transduction histidine kinase
VLDLRVGASAAIALIDQLEQAVDEINAMSSITFVPSSDGEVVDLLPGVHSEVFAVAAEALRNAYRHAGATQVELRLLYGSDEFRLDVLDDGSGIPNRMLVDGKANHWGLAGMKERAEAIGATLEFLEREGGGTVVSLQLTALLAYGPRMAPVSTSSP